MSALRPHILLSQDSDKESATTGAFTSTEALILDTYEVRCLTQLLQRHLAQAQRVCDDRY